MLQNISIFILIFASFSGAFAQTEKYTAPVKWERYKISDKDVSILFPKMPISDESSSSSCSEQASRFYASYAEDAVYMLRIVYITDEKPSKSCSEIERINENSFKSRLEEIKSAQKNSSEIKSNQNALEVIKIKGDFLTYWLIIDLKNKRWFELSVANKNDEDATVKNYVESFKVEKNPTGIEIGQGAGRTLGDEQSTVNDNGNSIGEKATDSVEVEVKGVKIVKHFPAKYTDVARRAQVQGIVRLRITFLENGGIGSVAVVSALPYGLTEQAIVAASKIMFLPARKNGVKIHSVRIVEYSFSIY